MKAVQCVAWLACGCLLTSCVGIYERYFVRVPSIGEDGQQNGSNYLRVTVSGYSFLSASQYAAGWYDKDAVDQLFGELGGKKVAVDSVSLRGHPQREADAWMPRSLQSREPSVPGDSGDGKPTAAIDKSASTDMAQVTSLDGEDLRNKRLVLFLSTNTDSLMNQLGAMATSAQIRDNLAAILLGPMNEQLERERVRSNASDLSSDQLASKLETLATDLEGSNEADPSGSTILRALRLLARNSGAPPTATFQTAEEALAWFLEHGDAFPGPEVSK